MLLPVPASRPLVLFTDLDGTLLDHHTYMPDAARDALRLLSERGTPLIFCSSKTFAEQVFLQKQLGLFQPFIFENGSAVAIPGGYFPASLSTEYDFMFHDGYEIFRLAHADAGVLRAQLALFEGVKGFSEVPDAELSAATGLNGAALRRARERWFTETLLDAPDAEQPQKLREHLAASGFEHSQGGRFLTVQSAQAGKGKALRWLSGVFRQIMDYPLFAAIGDSPNDAPMLAAVDIPFLVQKHDGTWTNLELPGLQKIEGIGPKGFSAAVRMLLG